jgi:hypothetical protein
MSATPFVIEEPDAGPGVLPAGTEIVAPMHVAPCMISPERWPITNEIRKS